MPKIPASTDSLPANGIVLPIDTSNFWPVGVITGTGLEGIPPPIKKTWVPAVSASEVFTSPNRGSDQLSPSSLITPSGAKVLSALIRHK